MFGPRDYYYHSHTSVIDGSPAMVLAHNWTTIWLQNEDGFVWSDPIDQWVRIENPVYPDEWLECGFCQQTDCDGECDTDYEPYPVEWDYPEYDAQTAFYESTGRMRFPNEY